MNKLSNIMGAIGVTCIVVLIGCAFWAVWSDSETSLIGKIALSCIMGIVISVVTIRAIHHTKQS